VGFDSLHETIYERKQPLVATWKITTRLRPQIGHQSQFGFDEIRAELGCVFTP
jgi:hypothetical protein